MHKEINLKEVFRIIKKRLWVIIATTIVITFAGFLFNALTPTTPLYQSSARMLVGADEKTMTNLMVLFKDPTVMGKVSEAINHQRSPGRLNSEISVNSIDQSQMVIVTVTDVSSGLAANIANAATSVFKSEAKDILRFSNIQTLSEGSVNGAPINPQSNRIVFITFVMGIVIGVGLALLLHSLDDSIQSEKDLEKLLDSPTLGNISKMKKGNMYSWQRKKASLEKDKFTLSGIWKMRDRKKDDTMPQSKKVYTNDDVSYTKQVHKINQ